MAKRKSISNSNDSKSPSMKKPAVIREHHRQQQADSKDSSGPKSSRQSQRSSTSTTSSSSSRNRDVISTPPKELNHKPAPLNHSDILGDLNSSLEHFDDSWLNDSNNHNKRNKKQESKYDASLDVTSRKGRTAVYAGAARTACYDYVPTLEELCLSVLKNNIHMIQGVGLAPYHLIKPVLSKCSWSELKRIESYNEGLIEDTDELWKIHCEKEFPNPKEIVSGSTWRKKFFRTLKKREKRLSELTQKIKKKTEKEAEPVKKTVTINAIAVSKGSGRSKMLPLINDSAASKSTSTASAIKATAQQTRVTAAKQPPKKAPLMQKTLQMFKQRYRGSR